MNQIEIKIFALEQLKKKIKECEAYDNFSANEMLSSFIELHGYDPNVYKKNLHAEVLTELQLKLSTETNKKISDLRKIELLSNIKEFTNFQKELKTELYQIYEKTDIIEIFLMHYASYTGD